MWRSGRLVLSLHTSQGRWGGGRGHVQGCGLVDDPAALELRDTAAEDRVAGGNGRRADVLLDVRAVDERAVDGVGNVGRGQHEDVLQSADLVQLGEEGLRCNE